MFEHRYAIDEFEIVINEIPELPPVPSLETYDDVSNNNVEIVNLSSHINTILGT